MSKRMLFALASLAAIAVACASGAGVERHPGVRFYDRPSAAPPAPWDGGLTDVSVFVVSAGSSEGITGRRALAVRDAIRDLGRGDRGLFSIVLDGEITGDTLGEVLWAPDSAADRQCISYTFSPGDSIRPASRTCNRVEVSSRETWNPTPLLRTVFEAGGNAVLLREEDYSGTFRGLRGVVLRTPDGRP